MEHSRSGPLKNPAHLFGFFSRLAGYGSQLSLVSGFFTWVIPVGELLGPMFDFHWCLGSSHSADQEVSRSCS